MTLPTPTATVESMVADLRQLGLRPGDRVLVHSSFRAIGPVEGGPTAVILALIQAIGPTGLVVFPTHTWDGNKPDQLTVFDVRNSPSRVIGILPEFARTWPGAVRSVHPTHSVVAIGAGAAWLTAGHAETSTQTGMGSPYRRLADHGGKILLLGVDHERNTSIHGVEEELKVPNALDSRIGTAELTDANGRTFRRAARFHSWTERRFMVVDELMTEQGAQTLGAVAQAPCRLVQAGAMVQLLHQRLAANPLWLYASLP